MVYLACGCGNEAPLATVKILGGVQAWLRDLARQEELKHAKGRAQGRAEWALQMTRTKVLRATAKPKGWQLRPVEVQGRRSAALACVA
eukprot:5043228-Pyramimonas_sp.AAC.1